MSSSSPTATMNEASATVLRNPSEMALVERARRGDHDAFAALIEDRLQPTFRTVLAILGNESDARDATQAAFVQAWRNLPQLRDPATFPAWFGRIVVNTARTSMRGRRRRIIREIQVSVLPGEGAAMAAGDAGHEDRTAALDRLERALDRPGACRTHRPLAAPLRGPLPRRHRRPARGTHPRPSSPGCSRPDGLSSARWRRKTDEREVRADRRGDPRGVRAPGAPGDGSGPPRPDPGPDGVDGPGRRPWTARLRWIAGHGSAARILALAILVAALLGIGLAVVGGRPVTPEPTPVPGPLEKAAFFARPVEYRVPSSSSLKLTSVFARLLTFNEGGGDVYGRAEDGSLLPGAREITISSANAAVTHPCPGGDGQPSRVPIREQPLPFLADLGTIAGIGFGEPVQVEFDGRPALAVTVDPAASRCPFGDFHVLGGALSSGYVLLSVPARLVVTDVDGMTIVLQAWAATKDDLDAWMPTATEFLDSVHFIGQP